MGGGRTQQSRENKPHGHHSRRAQKNRRLGTAMGEAIAVDHRPDSLAEIEEARVQRSGRTARGLREFGDMDLDTAVQQVESEPEHGVNGDLPKPGKVQRDEDQTVAASVPPATIRRRSRTRAMRTGTESEYNTPPTAKAAIKRPAIDARVSPMASRRSATYGNSP